MATRPPRCRWARSPPTPAGTRHARGTAASPPSRRPRSRRAASRARLAALLERGLLEGGLAAVPRAWRVPAGVGGLLAHRHLGGLVAIAAGRGSVRLHIGRLPIGRLRSGRLVAAGRAAR